MNANRLNTNSVLAYMGIRALENKNTPVFISMSAPAKTDWGTKEVRLLDGRFSK